VRRRQVKETRLRLGAAHNPGATCGQPCRGSSLSTGPVRLARRQKSAQRSAIRFPNNYRRIRSVSACAADNAEGSASHEKVRIDPCGQALCGVIAAANPSDTDWRNPDPGKRDRPLLGVPILIDMKPTKKQRWEGQVYSAKSGYTYAAKMALKSADVLRVEGCVLGGLFCNSQNWTRAKDASAP
jgi:Uncharacterized protein conserved in bacteria (DUF2147)